MDINKNKALFYDSFSTFLSIGNQKSNNLARKDLTSDQGLKLFIKYTDFCSDKKLSYKEKYELFSQYYNYIAPENNLSFEDHQKIRFKIKELDKEEQNNTKQYDRHPTNTELFTELLRIKLTDKELQRNGKRLNVFDIIKTEYQMRKQYNINNIKKISPYTQNFIQKNFVQSRLSKKSKNKSSVNGISNKYKSKYNYLAPNYILDRLKRGAKIGGITLASAITIFAGVAKGISVKHYIDAGNEVNSYSYSQAISEGKTLTDMGLSEGTVKDFNEVNQLLEKYKNIVPNDQEIKYLLEKEEKLHDEILFDKTKSAYENEYPNSELKSISEPQPIMNSENKTHIDGYYIKLNKGLTNPEIFTPTTLYLSNNMWWNINTIDIVNLKNNLLGQSKEVNDLIHESKNEYVKADNYEKVITTLNNDMDKLKNFVAMDFKIEDKSFWDSWVYTRENSKKITPTVPKDTDDRTQ